MGSRDPLSRGLGSRAAALCYELPRAAAFRAVVAPRAVASRGLRCRMPPNQPKGPFNPRLSVVTSAALGVIMGGSAT